MLYQCIKKPIILLSFLLLVNCSYGNWNLAQQVTIADKYQKIYIASNRPYSELIQQLKLNLKASKIELVEDINKASSFLTVHNEKIDHQAKLLAPNGEIREKYINYEVHFSWTDSKGKILLDKNIKLANTIYFDKNNMDVNNSQLSEHEKILRKLAIKQILHLLSKVDN